MVLTLLLTNDWTICQVDCTSAFTQADLNEKVYIEFPKSFLRREKRDMVLPLIKSLYGLKQAPRSLYDKLSAELLERGFIKSEINKCLFMKKSLINIVYVDDTIITIPISEPIDDFINRLGIANEEQFHVFELHYEGEIGNFLGVRIQKSGPSRYTLTQTGLIDKVLREEKMESCNSTKIQLL